MASAQIAPTPDWTAPQTYGSDGVMKPDAQMPPASVPPCQKAPQGACDSHVHLVGGPEFPLWDGRVENPAPGPDFHGWLDLYKTHLNSLGFDKGVIVHSILYGTDNSVTVQAVKQMGQDFKGVGLLPDDATDAQLNDFAGAGICALRLNYVHGGVLSWEGAKALAPRLADRDMHIQMLLNSHLHVTDIAQDIRQLGVPLVIDHLGWPDLSLGVEDAGFQILLRLLADGHIYLKLSALYRLCPAPYDQADAFVKAALAANSERCLWGSDWPHLMLADAKMPASNILLDAFDRCCPNTETRQRVLVDNPNELFSF